MFANAYEIARKYTFPVIISTRNYSGKVECGCGAFIVINDEGWILTTAHIFNSYINYQQHRQQIQKYKEQKQEILENLKMDEKQKKKRIAHLKTYPGWLENHSFWWGMDGVRLKQFFILKEGDLLLGQLDPFDKNRFDSYPAFKNPDTMKFATSLCKLGYPFHKVESTYNVENHNFEIKKGTLPIPLFPIEGIYTRKLIGGESKDGNYKLSFLETSTPGLRGQSGGPIFDSEGKVWAIQSRTMHHPLGFSPKIMRNGREVEENQFLNVGVGVHSELIIQFLQKNNIKFTMSD